MSALAHMHSSSGSVIVDEHQQELGGSALSITWPGRLILYGSLGGATDDSELVSAILSGWGFRP